MEKYYYIYQTYFYTFGYNCAFQEKMEGDNIAEGIIYINIT